MLSTYLYMYIYYIQTFCEKLSNLLKLKNIYENQGRVRIIHFVVNTFLVIRFQTKISFTINSTMFG